MRQFIFTALLLAGLTISTQSQSEEFCVPTNTAIYFGNGVGQGADTHFNAERSRTRLQRLVLESIRPEDEENYVFKLAFNDSRGALADIAESARQTLGNEWPTLLVGFLLQDRRLLSLLPSDVVQQFNDFLTNQTIQEMIAPDLSNTNLASQVASYESDIGEGKKVVLVSHSQGNIFANLAFQRLSSQSQQYFAMVPVASPESFARKSLLGHVRFSDDVVIGGVAVAKLLAGLPPPLSANDDDNVDEDWTGHGFREAYLADASARQFIVSGILSSESILPPPPQSAGQGTITVTLTWGSNPDVDLHTYEPTGTHVYYARPTGNFGYLDVDDVTSYGPEHYFVSCQRLRENQAAVGRYRFGVNYYYGQSPEVAQVTVKTPSSEATYSKVLPVSRGFSGNNSPIPVADVVVSKNPDTGRFDFSIEEK